jgi:hypothetical protein
MSDRWRHAPGRASLVSLFVPISAAVVIGWATVPAVPGSAPLPLHVAGHHLADRTGNAVIYANHTYPFKGDTLERWQAKLHSASKSLPVIVSEFGSEARGRTGANAEDWVRRVLQTLQDRDLDWIAWDQHP